MPSTITVGRVYQITQLFAGLYRPAVVVHYWECLSVIGTGTDDVSFANAVAAVYGPLFKALLTNNSTYQGVSIQDVTTAPPHPVAIASTGSTGSGTAGTTPLPAQTCGIFTKQTALAGRGQRGRVYVPFPDFADNQGTTQPTPTAGYQTRLGLLAAHFIQTDAFLSGGNGFAGFHVLFHRRTRTTTPILNARENAKWATQRRRGVYGAAHR
jgi:hypothetical protein